jgi:outer membrane protein insertion porin family
MRFAARLGFEIEPKTAEAISDVAEKIKVVSAERIAEEMRKILVNEGPRTTVRSLSFTGQTLVPESELRKGLQLTEGKAFNENLLSLDQYTIYSKFFELGNLAANVGSSINIDSIMVDILWRIDPKIPVRIDSIKVTGNSKVKESLVRRELVVEKGGYFNLSRALESKQNLYDTGFFNSVEIEPYGLDLPAGEVNLDVQVRERKMGYIEAGFGVGNVHANRIFGEWGQRNLLGRGYALKLKAEVESADILQRIFETGCEGYQTEVISVSNNVMRFKIRPDLAAKAEASWQ